MTAEPYTSALGESTDSWVVASLTPGDAGATLGVSGRGRRIRMTTDDCAALRAELRKLSERVERLEAIVAQLVELMESSDPPPWRPEVVRIPVNLP